MRRSEAFREGYEVVLRIFFFLPLRVPLSKGLAQIKIQNPRPDTLWHYVQELCFLLRIAQKTPLGVNVATVKTLDWLNHRGINKGLEIKSQGRATTLLSNNRLMADLVSRWAPGLIRHSWVGDWITSQLGAPSKWNLRFEHNHIPRPSSGASAPPLMNLRWFLFGGCWLAEIGAKRCHLTRRPLLIMWPVWNGWALGRTVVAPREELKVAAQATATGTLTAALVIAGEKPT